MIRYAVKINIDDESYKKAVSEKKVNCNLLKGWDFVSPLYGSGKGSSVSASYKLDRATMFVKKESAILFSKNYTHSYAGYYGILPFVTSVEIIEIFLKPRIFHVVKSINRSS